MLYHAVATILKRPFPNRSFGIRIMEALADEVSIVGGEAGRAFV